MNKINAPVLWDFVPYMMKKLPSPGILLVCGNEETRENVITLGWLQFGVIWNEPVVSILVRPTRYSFELLKFHNEFTINIMPDEYNDVLQFCGSNSGKYLDKFSETRLKKINSREVKTSSLKDAELTLECKTLYKGGIVPDNLSDLVLAKFYRDGDYHVIIDASISYIKSNLERSLL